MKNYYRYLLDIESSEITKDAILVISDKDEFASIKFESSELENKFDSSINTNKEDLSHVNSFNQIICSVGCKLGLDWDGDSVLLDIFIATRDYIIHKMSRNNINISALTLDEGGDF